MKDQNPEFKIGDIVTLDRYNHIDDVEKVEVVGYGEMPISKALTYKMNVNGIIIESTGGSIVESRLYNPVAGEERHHRKMASTQEIESYWHRVLSRGN